MTDRGCRGPWSRAWREASGDFWSRAQPKDHFSTSVGSVLADRMVEILRDIDARLGHPEELTIVDVGCGDGELLALMRDRCAHLTRRARWVGVDIRRVTRSGIKSLVGAWPHVDLPEPIVGLVMAHEWLDEIPCDIVERDVDGTDRLVLVDDDGREHLGPPISDGTACARFGVDGPAIRAWLERWWPLRGAGDRAEIGLERDRAWAWLTSLLEHGTALATDYGHDLDSRPTAGGTLTAYRRGRLTSPVPDGRSGLTAHVAMDSCAAARPGSTLSRQRHEIAARRTDDRSGLADVNAYFEALRLRDPARLGRVGWLRWEC